MELLFFPERQATFEDLDPSRWRGSCKLVVEEDFQETLHVQLAELSMLCAPSVRSGAGVW